VVLLAIGLVTTSPSDLDPSSWSARSVLGLIYLILVGSVVGYTAYAWLLANAPLGQVSTYAYVNPVVAIALGVIVLNEKLTLRVVLGALLILVAVAIVVRRESLVALEPSEVVGPDRDARELAAAGGSER
jgi:drug/metabolite transporter (DMT)-like permease